MLNRTLIRLMLLAIGLVVLAACNTAPEEPADAEQASIADNFTPIVSATGEVVPALWATLGAPSSGFLTELSVQKGDEVAQGQVLARIGNEDALRAAVTLANLELVAAQQALDDLHAQSAMIASQTQLDLANARDELRDAEYIWSVRQEGNRASPETIRQAEAKLTLAEDALKDAKAEYDSTGGGSDDPRKALALVELVNAQTARDSALRNLNWFTGRPTEIQQGILDAEVAAAQALVDELELEYEKWKDGPAADELALVEARIANAQAQVDAAAKSLADLEIRAPFDGTIGEVYPRQNEWVTIGSPIVLIADLNSLEVETTDLNELDVARISVGNPSTITFDPLPDTLVSGTVLSIAPRASEGSGVNYSVIIGLDEIPEQLRWAMTAFVDIEVED